MPRPRITTAPGAIALLLSACLALPLRGQSMKRMEFLEKPFTDILMALSMQSGVSIVADETVVGKANFFFPETDFRTALQAFLAAHNLYQREENGVIRVSRMSIYAQKDGTMKLDAEDIDPGILLRAVSRGAGKTILYDSLPKTAVTIHSEGVSLAKAVEIIMKPFPEYSVSADKDLVYVKRSEASAAAKAGTKAQASLITRAMDGSYSVDFAQARFLDLVDELMRCEKREYAFLFKADLLLERMRFSGKSYEQLLRLFLEQAGADCAVRDDIVYIFEIQKKEVSKKLKLTQTLYLRRLPVQDAVALLSQDLANSALYRVDKSANAFILSGSAEEIGPIRDFLEALDAASDGKELYRYRASFLKARELIPIIPARLLPTPPIQTPNEYVFFVQLPPERKPEFDAFMAMADRKDAAYPVRLKYLKAEELLKLLPPSATKEDLVESGSPSLLFFQGSRERLARFAAELELLDRPKPQIRYDVLAVQYNRQKGLAWKPSYQAAKISGSPESEGSSALMGPDGTSQQIGRDAWALVGSLGELIGINFDVISKLGLEVGAGLSASLGDARSHIFADTTVTVLSGQEAKFQNTTTVRVRQAEVDADTKAVTYSGPTTEVSSGLVLSVNGWTSGEGMVTMSVSASLSERGSPSGGDSANGIILPTSERVISTQLRTRSGEPIVISGLLQQSDGQEESKTPVLGDIPLLGWLFKKRDSSREFREMAVYIVPRILEDEAGSDFVSLDLESYHREFGPERAGAAP
jgi:type II secretory pathway component GspD/PulD (secretin)